MFKKNSLSIVLLMLLAGLFSVNSHARSQYPASDFKPRIIFQNEEVKRLANPPKPMPAETPPIAQLLIIIMLGCLGAYLYKNKFQNAENGKPRVATANVAKASSAKPDRPTAPRHNSAPIKRINKNYKGYRSPRLSD